MDKVYKIFISSISKDLIMIQKLITQTLSEMNCFPTEIKFFQDSNELQLEQIKKILDSCNCYVIITMEKYDTLDVVFQKKYTQINYVLKIGIPIIIFIRKSIENLPTKKTKEFLEFIEYGKIESWSNPYELIGKISVSIHNIIEEYDKVSRISTTKNYVNELRNNQNKNLYKKRLKIRIINKYKSINMKLLLNESELILSGIREFTSIIFSAGSTALSEIFDMPIIPKIPKINFYEICDNLNSTIITNDKINIVFNLYGIDIFGYIILSIESDFLLDFYIESTQKYFSNISSIKSIKEYKNSMFSEIGNIFSSTAITALASITSSLIRIKEIDVNYLKNKLNEILPFYIGSLSITNTKTTFDMCFILDKKSIPALYSHTLGDF